MMSNDAPGSQFGVADCPEQRYHVTWSIHLWARTPQEAAQRALEIQRDPASFATIFDVDGDEESGFRRTTVDLYPPL